MGMKREVKIYTRTGDQGMTSICGGKRVRKDDVQIELYGGLDELNACIGYLLTQDIPIPERALLGEVQNTLFEIGVLFSPIVKTDYDLKSLSNDIVRLEQAIDIIQDETPMPKGFVLPGGCPSASWAHVARTVCRRVERTVWRLPYAETLPSELLSFINRLSDYLYALSLKLNFTEGKQEILWQKRC